MDTQPNSWGNPGRNATQQQKKKDKPDYIKGEHQREKGEDGASRG